MMGGGMDGRSDCGGVNRQSACSQYLKLEQYFHPQDRLLLFLLSQVVDSANFQASANCF